MFPSLLGLRGGHAVEELQQRFPLGRSLQRPAVLLADELGDEAEEVRLGREEDDLFGYLSRQEGLSRGEVGGCVLDTTVRGRDEHF